MALMRASPASLRLSSRSTVDVALEPGMLVRGISAPAAARSFYGVPYARAGRWEEPRAVRWRGVRDATSAGPSCMQPGAAGSSEDCLGLDVMLPGPGGPEGRAAPLPVFVWFFGGGYVGGGAAESAPSGEFPVERLVSQGLAVVVPNFRLGAFGYLGSNRARRNSTGNWGLLDQVMALKWVSSYIHAFGGDPARVTVGGWSSGAASISALLTMDSTRGLLQAAIMMSGGFTDWAVFELEAAESTYDALLRQTGCQSSADCLREGPPCGCLLSVSSARLAEVEGSLSWAPVADGAALRALPYAALERGEVHGVPILVGSTLEDCFPVLPDDATEADFEAWLQRSLPAEAARRARELYLGRGAGPEIDWVHAGASKAHWAAQRAVADRGQTCVARRVARRWPAGAWQYHWRARFRGEDTSGFGPGISHSSDQHFLFQREVPPESRPAARAVQRAVALFVRGGSPGSWWPAGGGRGPVFYSGGPVVGPIRSEQCDFWDAVDAGRGQLHSP